MVISKVLSFDSNQDRHERINLTQEIKEKGFENEMKFELYFFFRSFKDLHLLISIIIIQIHIFNCHGKLYKLMSDLPQ